ncbi:hypothetical protein BST95_02455 [Halioglobus japonicus]|uniref:hypothetical protein n=1 Tax=Halioglobus japonicus TaxID=930805 RepID=UPI000979522D|nr:hypothetical protein [Halioglobus japonicus]AQA17252.1 hypothetical protein BST95_02455 [Halioglobus japonicus]GHD19802.1 hypothetical protein GCM10007052_28730 [Halioglobus japonicus]
MYPNPTSTSLSHLDYRWVFAASLLLSAWLIAIDPLINRDAIIYLRAADAYLQHGFAASQQEFGRPLLSICIALIHNWTGLSTLWAGQLITTLAYAVLCTGFVAVIHVLGGDRRIQLLGAIVVLSHPLLNHLRSSIMRDPIYWALLILAFRELLLYLRSPTLKYQVRWFSYIVLASLFRFEGLFFAALAPLAVLFTRNVDQRLRHCLHLLIPQLIAIGIAAAGIVLYRQGLGSDTNLFPAINQYLERLWAFPGQFAAMSQATGQAMLEFTALEDASIAVTAGLLAVLAINICRAITWPWVAVLVWGRLTGLLGRLRNDDVVLLRAHALIALLYLALFMLINRFMLERYSIQLVLFLLLYLPFLLGTLWNAGGWRKGLVILLLVGMSLDTVLTGDGDKRFIREATQWVEQNTDAQASIATNEKYIAYFSRRDFDWTAALGQEFKLQNLIAKSRHWRNKDYLVIYVRRRDEAPWAEFLANNHLTESRSFASNNPKKGRVAVVQVGEP